MSGNCRLVWPTQALLGEGPMWSIAEQALYFVDIKGGGAVHRHDPATGAQETMDVGGMPSFVVPVADGGLLVGSRGGLYRLQDGALGERIAEIAMPAHNRTNDATVDGHGRLWFGTMDDEENIPTGRVFCLDGTTPREMGCDAVVTNGPAVSADGRTLYHVDSGQREIWRYPVLDGPALGDRELFLRLTEADGHPDGIVLDSEGCLWVALWDGWGVQRYAPDGTLLLRIDLPCARVTKIAFGGPDLRTAFVTTARVGLSEEQLTAQPLAGGLFAFDAPVAGLPLPAVKLPA